MINYKYELQKGSKHTTCPECKRKTFKPYVYVGTNDVVDKELYGRCERVNNCAFTSYPKLDGDDNWEPPEVHYQKLIPDFVSEKVVHSTFVDFNKNPFLIWLIGIFGKDKTLELQKLYNIGTAKYGGTIFWQKDKEGNFRTGKVIYYNKNGNRRKDKNGWFVHNRISKDFILGQVFFGEHLIDKNKPLALCESEKTAILMSQFQPEFIWIAAGGSNMLNTRRILRIPRLDFVSPDEGQFELWENQTHFFENRQMDLRVEKAFKKGFLKKGDDILDLILKEKTTDYGQ